MDFAPLALLAQTPAVAGMMQSIFMRQFLLTSGNMFLQIMFMVILFWLIAYKPEQIRHPRLMRWSYILLVTSLLVPSAMYMLLGVFISSDFYSLIMDFTSPGRGMRDTWLFIPNVIGPSLLAVSLYLGFASLALGPVDAPRTRAKSVVAQKHPLD